MATHMVAKVGLFVASGCIGLIFMTATACGQNGCNCAPTPMLISGDTIFSGLGPTDGFRGTVPGPSPRYLASIAYDASHKNFALFGGHTANSGVAGETLIFERVISQSSFPAWRLV